MKRYEVVVGIGPSHFYGDVGGFSRSKNILGLRDITLKQIRYNINASFKYRINQRLNARLSFTLGSLHATDVRGSNEGRAFESSIFFVEPALIGEYYFIKNKAENSYLFTKGKDVGLFGMLKSLDFYALAGIGGIGYSINANNLLVDHGIKPGGFAAVIPLGIGATLIYNPNINFGVEFTGRYSFSDNIDGYTSQFSRANDVYHFFIVTFTYKLKTGANGLPSFR